jgi:hypothetical protein
MGMLGAAGSYACGSNNNTNSGPPDQEGLDSSTPADGTAGDDSSMGTDSTGPGTDAAAETATGSDAPHDGQGAGDSSQVNDAFFPDGFLETYDATADTSITTELDSMPMDSGTIVVVDGLAMPDGPILPTD